MSIKAITTLLRMATSCSPLLSPCQGGTSQVWVPRVLAPETPSFHPAVEGLGWPWLQARLPELWVHQGHELEGCMTRVAGPLLALTFFRVPREGQVNPGNSPKLISLWERVREAQMPGAPCLELLP